MQAIALQKVLDEVRVYCMAWGIKTPDSIEEVVYLWNAVEKAAGRRTIRLSGAYGPKKRELATRKIILHRTRRIGFNGRTFRKSRTHATSVKLVG